MKRIVVVAISCALAVGAWGAPPPKFKTKWSDAEQAAKAADKPMFVHFSVSWSGEDLQMEKDVLTAPAVQKALADFVPLSLDCTVKPRFEPTPTVKAAIERMRACGGENHPFFAVVTPDGDFLHAIRGYLTAEEMVAQLEKALAARTEYDEFHTYAAKADHDAVEFKIRQLKFCVKFRKFPKAQAQVAALLRADPDGSKGLAGEAKLALIAITPPNEGPAATQEVYEELKKLDPRNEKGLWERAVMAQGERHYRSALDALRGGDEVEFRGKLVRPAKMVEDLLDHAARFDDRRSVHHMALFLYTSQKNFDKAHTVVDELMKTAPAADKPAVLRLRLGVYRQQEQFAQARKVIEELLKTATAEETADLQRLDKELQLRAMIQENSKPEK